MEDGSYFEGMWVEGWRHGKGKEVLNTGHINIGVWDNHNFVENTILYQTELKT